MLRLTAQPYNHAILTRLHINIHFLPLLFFSFASALHFFSLLFSLPSFLHTHFFLCLTSFSLNSFSFINPYLSQFLLFFLHFPSFPLIHFLLAVSPFCFTPSLCSLFSPPIIFPPLSSLARHIPSSCCFSPFSPYSHSPFPSFPPSPFFLCF